MDKELMHFHLRWQLQLPDHQKWIANWYFEPSWSRMCDIISSCWSHFLVYIKTNAQHPRLFQSNNCNEHEMDLLDQDKWRFHCEQHMLMSHNKHWSKWLYSWLGLSHWANGLLSCWLSNFLIHSSLKYWDDRWHILLLN